MNPTKKRSAREMRKKRVRRKVWGTAERPRLSVYRSNAGIYAQLVDDERGHTIVAASSIEDGVAADGTKTEAARRVGTLVAERATKEGIETVVFDRGGFQYAGRVKALADAAREAGLKF